MLTIYTSGGDFSIGIRDNNLSERDIQTAFAITEGSERMQKEKCARFPRFSSPVHRKACRSPAPFPSRPCRASNKAAAFARLSRGKKAFRILPPFFVGMVSATGARRSGLPGRSGGKAQPRRGISQAAAIESEGRGGWAAFAVFRMPNGAISALERDRSAFLKTGKAVVRRRAKAYALFRNVPDFAARCRKKLRRARLLNKKGM